MGSPTYQIQGGGSTREGGGEGIIFNKNCNGKTVMEFLVVILCKLKIAHSAYFRTCNQVLAATRVR